MDFNSEEESQGEGGEEKIVPAMKENGTSSSLWFRMDAKRGGPGSTTTIQKPTTGLPTATQQGGPGSSADDNDLAFLPGD